jgi:uncharacterized protein (DUF433 family)
MSALESTGGILPKMNRAEMAQLLQWTQGAATSEVRDARTGIESRAAVCCGDPCIAGTSVPVWVLEQARRLGISELELLEAYPMLDSQDLANAWAYIRSHRAEVARQIEDNEAI